MTQAIQDERGQATVEFALILPVLLLLVLGIIEFGKAWNLAQVATDAVREGARRCVIADPTITQAMVEIDIKNRMAQAGVPTTVTTVQFEGDCESSDQPVRITARVPYSWMFFRLLDPITLTSSFTMRNE
ncbi:MAG: TadE/TadG family type IV pilus assembly protein [Gemmatimonadales bacterium]